MLWLAAEDKGFTTNEYATFKQWETKKETVRKGEKGNMIVFYDVMERENEKQKIEKIPFLKLSFVFNRSQLKSYEPSEIITDKPQPLFERIAQADTFINQTGARIKHDGGERAYYNRLSDDIHLPLPEIFTGTETQSSQESYYAVTLHELTHLSGHPKRLDRQFGKRFGDQDYAFEELVAEIGAAFLCAKLGITDAPRPDHAQYLSHWLQVLKDDKLAILTAASKASQACDYLGTMRESGAGLVQPVNDNKKLAKPKTMQLRLFD